jgi:hypothetical protein
MEKRSKLLIIPLWVEAFRFIKLLREGRWMSERRRDFVLIGILICLIVIALKPVPQMSVNQTPAESPRKSKSPDRKNRQEVRNES